MMLSKKKNIFVTSTRADFGKLKSLINIIKTKKEFEVFIVITGMHMLKKFGSTYIEVIKSFKSNIIKFKNQKSGDRLETILAKTIKRFSKVVKEINPDLIVIHGDRVEALGCASVGALNHILTAHIEGGEISGTIDDSIRHSITKLSHIHFVGTNVAKKRVIKMGEKKQNIFVIGSPDTDIILKKKLPRIEEVKKRYDILFKEYSILLWHPVTSEIDKLKKNTIKLINFCKNTKENFIIIYPNNDPGNNLILESFRTIKTKKFRLLRSLRFEHFLSLLKRAKYIIGNSSSAIYEAPILGTPAINIGNRQHKRLKLKQILNLDIDQLKNHKILNFVKNYRKKKDNKIYGYGNSDKKFYQALNTKTFWNISRQKYFSEK